ncbi:Methylenetetrahydrofolate reductase [Desulfonema limicola]|uniref:Methylenetetrahydrofolate reductase n=1 Tax=Desulfonema limicola TaxID=45656 RepID=A0A975B549_9BACT|nr:methylenetetrahydrofolate reductase [Desulfonema limicola]QTA78924.1 Methylenetetrahydrofolate reductase [Desulfonema limicola]
MDIQEKLDNGRFIVLAEIVPPKGTDTSEIVENAVKIKDNIDAFVISDMTNAIMQMSSLACAGIFQSKGMETIMQICCRDRNRIALQADLLGACGWGIKNIMAVTGQNLELGDHHQAKPVDDLSLLELLEVIKTLQNGRDMADIEINGTPSFFTGSNLAAAGHDIDAEINDMKKKIDAGAEFFITSPVFDPADAMPFLENADKEKCRIIPTVLLFKSLGMARYMARNVPGINIPQELIKRLQKSKDKSGECIKIASEILGSFKQNGFDGVLVSTIGQNDLIPDIIKET